MKTLGILFALLQASVIIMTTAASSGKVKLVIDTDGVSDDIRAITLALQHPNAEVIAFTTTHGCVSATQATANVARVIRANGVSKKIPVFQGAESALIRREVTNTEDAFFGKDGLGDEPHAFPEVNPCDFVPTDPKPAAVALIDIFEENPDATLVCIGPLTNVALALKLNPKFATMPKNMVVMGGNFYGIGNVNSETSAEFNFHGDPEAAAIALKEMRCNVTIVPWEAYFLEGPKYEKLVDFGKHLNYDTPLSSFLNTATKIGRLAMEKNGRQYAYCDEIAVSTAIDPSQVIERSTSLRVNVELAGKYTRGQVMVDWADTVFDYGSNLYGASVNANLSQPITFVTTYNVQVVDLWMRRATSGDQKME